MELFFCWEVKSCFWGCFFQLSQVFLRKVADFICEYELDRGERLREGMRVLFTTEVRSFINDCVLDESTGEFFLLKLPHGCFSGVDIMLDILLNGAGSCHNHGTHFGFLSLAFVLAGGGVGGGHSYVLLSRMLARLHSSQRLVQLLTGNHLQALVQAFSPFLKPFLEELQVGS